MKKIKIKEAFGIPVVIFLLFSSLNSCNDYLDIDEYIYDLPTIDTVFNSKKNLIRFVNGAATWLPDENTFYFSPDNLRARVLPFQGASDENFSSWNDAAHPFMPFLLDFETQFTENSNKYVDMYKGIRAANIILQRIGEVPDLTDIDIRNYTGEAYFLRGYYYFMLLLQYGPIPILPEIPLDINGSAEMLTYERNSYDDCVEAICNDMEKAAAYLTQDFNSAQPYRPTAGTALAVISRLRLMAASPWYNGNTRYSGWFRTDGTPFFSQTNDNSKWAQAAVAAYRIIESKRYSIYTYKKLADSPEPDSSVSSSNYPDGAGDIDIFRSYSDLFTGEVPLMNNKESIWAEENNNWTNVEGTPVFLGGHNSLNITQGAVDAFRRKDGTDTRTDINSPYYVPSDQLSDPIGYEQEFSNYALKSAVPKMYNNMEMRFYASVGFCHRFWKCSGYQGSGGFKNVEVTYYADGNAYPHQSQALNFNYSGYTLVKYLNPADSRNDGERIIPKTYSKYRYAEILLNYAEALNELNGSHTVEINNQSYTVSRNLAEIKSAINQIRYRSGLPGIEDSDISSQDDARRIIKRERQVEFFCEGGRRYFDLRRWGDAQDAYNKKVTGMNVYQPSSNRKEFFKETELITPFAARKFSFKNYFWPIPYSAIKQNPKLVQNPGW
ncbi:MAG: RagB/SusD family nutrient uptake outer membrane protein [Prevotella sp.]|jgi:hypothetical protein|nr:RagB/SusD family nutrient uptake outer membrane protein [Prevotella sp.]